MYLALAAVLVLILAGVDWLRRRYAAGMPLERLVGGFAVIALPLIVVAYKTVMTMLWYEDEAELEDEELEPDDRAEGGGRIVPRRDDEFLCRSCFLVKPLSQLAKGEKDVLFGQPGLPLADAAAAVVAHTLAEESATESTDPWSRRDGWRLFGAAQRRG